MSSSPSSTSSDTSTSLTSSSAPSASSSLSSASSSSSTPSRPLFPTPPGGEQTQRPQGPPPPGSGYAASLYLFVFLATLLLLLALSVGILVRSFVLRRRFRRRVEEALAAGFLLPNAGPGGAARWRQMTRPTLHEVAVAVAVDEKEMARRWAEVQPLNATLLPAAPPPSEKAPHLPGAAVQHDAPGPASSPALARLFGDSRFPHSLAALRRRQEHTDTPPAEDAEELAQLPAEPQLQLAVLLAMPARAGEPAELALGVARERWQADKT